MTSHNDFDRTLSAWLVDEAPQRTPEGLLARTLVDVRRSQPQSAWIVALRGTGMGRRLEASRLVLVLMLIALLAVALLGGVLIGTGGHLPFGLAPTRSSPMWDSTVPQVVGLPGRFAFSSDLDGDADIYVMNPDRTNLVQVTNDPGAEGSPLWSPDGRRLAFVADRDGEAALYTINADGTGEQRVTTGSGEATLGAWSPDGNQIAYTDAEGTIRVINADGTVDRALPAVDVGAGVAYFPQVYGWMPAGDALLIVFDTSTEGGQIDVYRYRIADGRVTALTTTPGDDGTPALSPDGSQIAFQSDRDGGCLYLMDADGSNVSRLTRGCSKGFLKAWAPDGSMIGWAGAARPDFDQRRDIQIVGSDATGQTLLTNTNNVIDLAWGPSP